ncbi:MAG: hypothetical protein EAZ42_13460 [Verrucomicrobia bacterium]|nr:MAG: hypothetical protein EAZ42_13460 [Verrucomicrobiota bacterium]
MVNGWSERLALEACQFFYVPASTLIERIEWTSELWNYPDRTIGGDTYPCTIERSELWGV